jgi:hypothetical protein
MDRAPRPHATVVATSGGSVYNKRMFALEARGIRRPLRSARAIASSLPLLTRVGLAVLLVGFAIDVAAHLSSPHGRAAAIGHLVTLGGMGLSLAGVMRLALRRPPRAATTEGGVHDRPDLPVR